MSRLDDLLELTDRDLLAAHCAGAPDAFGEIFRRHRDRMWALALRTTHDEPSRRIDQIFGRRSQHALQTQRLVWLWWEWVGWPWLGWRMGATIPLAA